MYFNVFKAVSNYKYNHRSNALFEPLCIRKQKFDSKSIFLFTNNDQPHPILSDLHKQAERRVSDLQEGGSSIYLFPIGESFEVNKFYKVRAFLGFANWIGSYICSITPLGFTGESRGWYFTQQPNNGRFIDEALPTFLQEEGCFQTRFQTWSHYQVWRKTLQLGSVISKILSGFHYLF